MKILKVEVNNYRNIGGICVELHPSCSYIIGENNLGKSNFLDMLNTVCTGKSFDDEDYANVEQPIEILLAIQLDKQEWGFFGDNFSCADPSIINIKYVQRISDAFPTAICVDTGDSIPMNQLRKLNYYRYESTATPSKELKFDGKHGMGLLMNSLVEEYIGQNGNPAFINSEKMAELSEHINRSLSHIKGFRDYKIGASIASETYDIISRLLYLSDGERRLDTTGAGVQYIAMASIGMLCYIMGLYKSKGIRFEDRLFVNENGEKTLPIILSIDEPEVHLHPFLQRSLINYYKRVLNNEDADFRELLKECFGVDGIVGQIIIVTHSSDILVGDFRNLIRFYKNGEQVGVVSGASSSFRMSIDDEKHLIMHFPELKEAFYSHCAILIEGETEYGCIQGFSNTLSIPIDDLGISIVNAQGENSIKPIRRLLAAFKIPSIAIYDGDVRQGKQQTDKDFFTTEICFEVEVVKKLYSLGNQQLVRNIAAERDSRAMNDKMDKAYVSKYFNKQNISLDGYIPKSLNDVSDDDESDFCNMFSAWFIAKKGILLGRIVGQSLAADQIPECYSAAIAKAQEVAQNA